MVATAEQPGTRRRGPVGAVALAVIGGAVSIGLWWLAIIVFEIESYTAPTPPEVVEAFSRMPGYLFDNAWITFLATVQGFGITIVLGLVIGGVLGSSRTLERAFMPSLVALNAVPKMAFGPLLLVWLGVGRAPSVVMAVLLCFFPIVLAVITGLSRTPAELAELARSLSAGRLQTFLKVRFPSALPQIFVGLKVGLPLAVIGALLGELFGAGAGLGYIITTAGSDTALSFAAIALVAAMSIVLYYILVLIELILLPWVKETTG
ncbi:ABC transporter permease [Paractinoplanes rishiriensis]|uniref:ABC transporter permease n=1 Tax=Paractinoplanes rishiriensis TaxID=1050105 RepID=A0A919MVF9_9ACTN|nr:ABC transporter permease [Actinoplanes rishiriensis]GIF01377.1 ABC transporter permease [Actinoplanes rishiriensis]